jgi:hypothetical protein
VINVYVEDEPTGASQLEVPWSQSSSSDVIMRAPVYAVIVSKVQVTAICTGDVALPPSKASI